MTSTATTRLAVPHLIGMVHLSALPGAAQPRPLAETIAQAVEEAQTLERAGFSGIMIENFGDAPFYPARVPRLTVAAMTRVVSAVAAAVKVPIGVNVLRNDGLSALAVAAVTGAAFVRINVLVGAMVTDQGVIEGRAHLVARARASMAPHVAVMADVMVKHAQPLGATPDLAQLVHDTIDRGGADAVVVSGSGTGQPVDLNRLSAVRKAAGDAPVFIGSGATLDSLSTLRQAGASGVIVGTALKTADRVDLAKAQAFVRAFHP